MDVSVETYANGAPSDTHRDFSAEGRNRKKNPNGVFSFHNFNKMRRSNGSDNSRQSKTTQTHWTRARGRNAFFILHEPVRCSNKPLLHRKDVREGPTFDLELDPIFNKKGKIVPVNVKRELTSRNRRVSDSKEGVLLHPPAGRAGGKEKTEKKNKN